MKLYYKAGACSLSPHIVLREAGLAFELEAVNLGTKTTASGADYLAINPFGYVPALQLDDGGILTEGPAIVQYLADLVPEKRLAPPNGSRDRVTLQAWLNFIATELHKSHSPLFNPAAPEEWKAVMRELIGRRYDALSARMTGRDYLLDEFSVADAYLFTVLSWGRFAGIDLIRWPVLAGFQARILDRPAVRDALRAEGLFK